MDRLMERVESEILTEEWLGIDVEQGPVLAAALAAALVEYRRYVGQRNGHSEPDDDKTNWRMMSRLEQLRSPA